MHARFTLLMKENYIDRRTSLMSDHIDKSILYERSATISYLFTLKENDCDRLI